MKLITFELNFLFFYSQFYYFNESKILSFFSSSIWCIQTIKMIRLDISSNLLSQQMKGCKLESKHFDLLF